MSWVWWAIGTCGVAGTLLIGAILIFGWPVIIGTKLGRIALLFGTAGLGAAALYLKGRSEGKAAEKARQAKADQKVIKEAKHDQDDIAALPIDDVRRRLREQSGKH